MLAGLAVAVTLSGGGAWLAVGLMILLSALFFFMRALYSHPSAKWACCWGFRFGHRRGRLYDLFAVFVRLLIVGLHSRQLSRHPGYGLMFGILGAMALLSAAVAHRLHQRIVSGTAQRIIARISALDTELGLSGEEKTLSELVDAKGVSKSDPFAQRGRTRLRV